MGQIKTVLFDLGNVLAYIDFNEFWRTLGLIHQAEIAPFADGYKSWTYQYETGCISTNDYLSGLQSVFGQQFDRKQLEQAFANIIEEPIGGMLDVVKHVSRAHRTALVSNTNEIHYKLSLKKFDVLSVLHIHYLSYQMRVMKPAHGFYDAIIQDQNIDPSAMVLIDDLIINVEGARAVGMQAIKFDNPQQLVETLTTLDVRM
jgi:HAD superfamily hydrolase (TIGR01509 family)